MSEKKKKKDDTVSTTPVPEPAVPSVTPTPEVEREYPEADYVRRPSDRKRPADAPGRRY